jgi:signal transduction histidine kinase
MNENPPVKFLLVDDMPENLLALEGLLRRSGLEILKAASGAEALEILLSDEVALAILDVQMPGMDGFELAELMRGTSRTQHIPIIFLTAGALDDRRRFRGYEAGAVDFLFKPIEPTVLQGKAEVFFDLYRQRQELIRQRDQLRAAADEQARLYNEIVQLNESLEGRVKERTVELLEANEQLKGFAHSIAHDFRQHIRNVNVNAEIVLSEYAESLGPYRSNVERIRQVAKLMSQMTDDLLTFARLRNVNLHPVAIDLTALAKEIAQSSNQTYPRSQYRIAEGLTVCGDQTMFRIVLENLLDNAFKYSQKAPEPYVELGKDDEGFFVKDNGIGFDMVYANKLFMPFERLLGASEYSGTGMGLANVKRILDRHEGRIWVDAKPGVGATFHFRVDQRPDPC